MRDNKKLFIEYRIMYRISGKTYNNIITAACETGTFWTGMVYKG